MFFFFEFFLVPPSLRRPQTLSTKWPWDKCKPTRVIKTFAAVGQLQRVFFFWQVHEWLPHWSAEEQQVPFKTHRFTEPICFCWSSKKSWSKTWSLRYYLYNHLKFLLKYHSSLVLRTEIIQLKSDPWNHLRWRLWGSSNCWFWGRTT